MIKYQKINLKEWAITKETKMIGKISINSEKSFYTLFKLANPTGIMPFFSSSNCFKTMKEVKEFVKINWK